MKIQYTSRLFFGNYYIRVVVNTHSARSTRYTFDWTKPDELLLLGDFCKVAFSENDYILKDRYVGPDVDGGIRFNQMLYLKTEDQLQKVIKTFGSSIVDITKPYDANHKDQLSIRNIVVVRDKLLYKKYQYAVYFKYDPKKEVWNWLRAYAKDETDIKIDRISHWPRAYMIDDSHLTSIKLMWSEKIDYIKTVRLLPQSQSAPD